MSRGSSKGSHEQGAPVERRPDPASLSAGHELRDASARSMLRVLAMLLVGIAIVFVVVTGFETLLTGRLGNFQPPAGGVGNVPNVQPPPAPQLETANGQVLEELHATEDTLLDSYAWIDQPHGVVRIPITRALQLVLQRGLPTQPSPGDAGKGIVTRPESSSSGRTLEQTMP